MTIDTNELRNDAKTAHYGHLPLEVSGSEVLELFGRLEAAESARRDDYQNWMTALDRNAELLAKLEAAEKTNREWLRANAPGGWIDNLRIENESLRAKVAEMERLITWVKDECRLYPDSLDEKAFADRLLAAITHPKSGLQGAKGEEMLNAAPEAKP